MKKLSHAFPTYGERNVLLYYLIGAFSSTWFIIGNWLFYALRYITAYEMSVLEAVSFGIGLLLEIPSGAVADLLGKRLTTIVGLAMQTGGMLLFSLAEFSPWLLIIGNITIISSFAFISGSLEALVYDTLVETKKEKHYDKIASRVESIVPIVLVFTALVGGFLWRFSVHLPNVFTVAGFCIAFALSFLLREPKVDTYSFSWKQFKKQNVDGFKQLTGQRLRTYMPIFVSVGAAYYMWNAGIIRIAMGSEFGYDGETLSYLVAGVSIVSSILLFKFHSVKRLLGNTKGLILITLGSILGWLLGSWGGGLSTGAMTFLFLTTTGQLHRPWVSSIMNVHVPSALRATTISTLQFLIQLPYVLIVVFYGFLIERGQTHLFYLVTAILLSFSLLHMLALRRLKNQRS